MGPKTGLHILAKKF